MSGPRNDTDPPLAEPGKRPSGKDVGGMRSSADAGLGDAGERPASDDRATTRPATAPSGAAGDDDDGDTWRHAPIAPVDEQNPLKSLGRAVADTVTGGGKDTAKKPKR